MDTLFVKTKQYQSEYPIFIKDDFSSLEKAFNDAGFAGKKVCVITDSNTKKLYLDIITEISKKCFSEVFEYSFEAGEKSKTLDTIIEFYKFFTQKGLDRKSIIIALGGGVVGDMAGFAAATYMRGIKFVQIPTTLLSQVDSSVGGKVGVDFLGNKNMIGAFYQPEFVYINIKTLNTLPYEQVAAGMAEAIKYGYIIDKDFLDYFKNNMEKIKKLSAKEIKQVIYTSCKAKAYVVSEDEKESGLREILNFGHTFGHSIESLSDFRLLHGECVAVGIISALKLSLDRGYINQTDLKFAEKLFEFFELPTNVTDFDKEKIFKQMFSDKKTKNNKLNIVLLKKIGSAYTEKNINDQEVLKAIEYIVK